MPRIELDTSDEDSYDRVGNNHRRRTTRAQRGAARIYSTRDPPASTRRSNNDPQTNNRQRPTNNTRTSRLAPSSRGQLHGNDNRSDEDSDESLRRRSEGLRLRTGQSRAEVERQNDRRRRNARPSNSASQQPRSQQNNTGRSNDRDSRRSTNLSSRPRNNNHGGDDAPRGRGPRFVRPDAPIRHRPVLNRPMSPYDSSSDAWSYHSLHSRPSSDTSSDRNRDWGTVREYL